MCGILLTWDPNKKFIKKFDIALNDLKHRGPDSKNFIHFENDNLTLGHTRLKIIDLSNNSNQPFISQCGRWALIYNGEIYNYKQIKKEIGDRWTWTTSSDTEVLLASWSIWGKKSLNKLNGMFAFAVFDKKLKKISLVRDRFGIKPLYKIIHRDVIVVSSEIKPLLRYQEQNLADENVIRTYLEKGLYDHSNRTFFKNIVSVSPGTLTEIDLHRNTEKTEKWYSLEKNLIDLSKYNEVEIINEAHSLSKEAIISNLISDVELGLNVSGGVDSSMLVNITLNKLGHSNLFTQDYPGYSELKWVKQISKKGTLNTEKLSFERIDSYLSDTIISQTEPFGGIFVCGYNAIYNAAQKKNIKVLLDGNGVDEIFLGYEKYHRLYVQNSLTKKEFQKNKKEFENFWGKKLENFKMDSSIDGTVGVKPEVITNNLLKNFDVLLEHKNISDDPVKNLAINDLLYNKIPRGLRFNDRVSMYHSCELRVPFLDHRLVEFALSIPSNLLLNDRGSKVIFRKALAKDISNEVAFAKKRSIQSPQREWLGNQWKKFVKDILKSKSFSDRNWIVPSEAKKVYSNYLKGSKENSFYIWQWINLELWARAYLDNNVKT